MVYSDDKCSMFNHPPRPLNQEGFCICPGYHMGSYMNHYKTDQPGIPFTAGDCDRILDLHWINRLECYCCGIEDGDETKTGIGL